MNANISTIYMEISSTRIQFASNVHSNGKLQKSHEKAMLAGWRNTNGQIESKLVQHLKVAPPGVLERNRASNYVLFMKREKEKEKSDGRVTRA